MDALEKSEQDVDVGLEDVAAEDGEGGDVVLVVQHGGGVVAEHQGRPDDEEDAEEGDDEGEDVKEAAGLLEEDPGEDDGEDGRGGGDHVGIGDGHVLEGEEVDDEVGGAEDASQNQPETLNRWTFIGSTFTFSTHSTKSFMQFTMSLIANKGPPALPRGKTSSCLAMTMGKAGRAMPTKR